MGYSRLQSDVCVFILSNDKGGIKQIISVYVDDLLVCSSTPTVCEQFRQAFQQHVSELKSTFPVKRYLGVELEETTDSRIRLSQGLYIDELQRRFSTCCNLSKVKVPMSSAIQYIAPADRQPESQLLHEVNGCLLYVANTTHPEILAPVGILSKALKNPPPVMHELYDQILAFLYNHRDDYIQLGGRDSKIELYAFCDASYSQTGESKGRIGIVFYLSADSGAVVTISKMEKTVSHSSMESEISAIDLTIRYANYIRNFLAELHLVQLTETKIYCDSKKSIELNKSLRNTDRSRHLTVKVNYIREQINSRNVMLVFIPSRHNVADILTKNLSHDLFSKQMQHMKHGFDSNTIEDLISSTQMTVHNVYNHKHQITIDYYT